LKNTSIIVLGMHRSGTSAISGELERLGVFMGKNLFKPQKGVNNKGFFENSKLVSFNELLLDELETSWDNPLSFLMKNQLHLLEEKYLQKANNLISSEYGQQELWGMKDPRVSMLLPFWMKVLEQQNVKAYYLFIIRNPIEVLASLTKRDKFHKDKSLMLWLNYNFSCFLHTYETKNRLIISFQDLIKDTNGCTQSIIAKFNLPIKANDKDSFVDSSLKNHTNSTTEFTFLEQLSLNLYTAILANNIVEVKNLESEYLEYLNTLDDALIDHIRTIKKSEVHYRNLFMQVYKSYSWKIMLPFKKVEDNIKKLVG